MNSSTIINDTNMDIQKLVNNITNNLVITLKESLSPFIEKMIDSQNKYKLLTNLLKQLPEFQHLVSENIDLQMEISNLKLKFNENEKIILQIREIDEHNENSENITEKVKNIYENSNIKSNNIVKDKVIPSDIYKEEPVKNKEEDEELVEYEELEEDEEDEELVEYEELVEDEEDEETDNETKQCIIERTPAIKIEANSTEEEEEQEVVEEEVVEEEEEEEVVEEEEEVEVVEEEVVEEEEEEEVVEEEEEQEVVEEEVVEEEVVEEEEEEEEEEEVEEEEVDEEEEVEVDEEEEEEAEEEEEEVFIVEIDLDGKLCEFYTNDEENGDIYEINKNEEIGNKIGVFINGEPKF